MAIEIVETSYSFEYRNRHSHFEWCQSRFDNPQPETRQDAIARMEKEVQRWQEGTEHRLIETVKTAVAGPVVSAPKAKAG